jgi:hypothetical protein
MNGPINDRGRKGRQELWSTVFLFGFGLFLLAFLIGIDHQNWFHIRPVSGTAAAMSLASDKAQPDD